MGLLSWALIFLIAAVVFAVLGFGFLADVAGTIAKWLFVIFIIVFVVILIKHLID
jgi:uncharacterized membrane protein YtjA (UPF0391 family)